MPSLGLGLTVAKPVNVGGEEFSLLNAPMSSPLGSIAFPLQLQTYSGGDGYQVIGGDHNYSGWMENGLGFGPGVNDGMTITAKSFNFSTPAAYSPKGTAFELEVYNNGYNPRKIALMAKDDYEKFGMAQGPYAAMRYRGAKGYYWGNVFNTGKSYLAKGNGDVTTNFATTKKDGWSTTFNNIWAYNPYAPNKNCPHKMTVDADGYLRIYRDGKLEYTAPEPIDYDFVVMVEGSYIGSYTRNIKITGTFIPLKFTNGWEDGSYVTMSKYGTANVNGYMGNTMMFGNGNGAQVKADYKMLPGSWFEIGHPSPTEIVGPLTVNAAGCNWVLINEDRGEGELTKSEGIHLHYQSNTNHNQYLNGKNFSRSIWNMHYEDPELIEDSGWTDMKAKRNAFDNRTMGFRLRYVWGTDKKLSVWLNHKEYGLMLIHSFFAPDLVEWLHGSEALYPWALWDNAYAYAHIRMRMGGNLKKY